MNCTIDGCTRPMQARQMCKFHWRRWRTYGDPRISKPRGWHAKTHGHCTGYELSAEYSAWRHIMQRCRDRRCKAWKDYGARGITICERWNRFEPFFEDVGPRPSKFHSIERIDNDGNYEPGNVRWATRSEQQRNNRRNRFITFRGETLCLVDWAARLGLTYQCLQYRIRKGHSLERILSPESQLIRDANGRFSPSADEIQRDLEDMIEHVNKELDKKRA